jgi:hypothetical protein
VTALQARPVIDAVLAALTAGLPPAYYVGEAQGPAVPAQSCPAVVVYGDVGTFGGYPYTPGSLMAQTLTLVGIGETPVQAMAAGAAARDVLLAQPVTISGRRVIFTDSDTQQPYPNRDDSLTPALFTQAVLLNIRN